MKKHNLHTNKRILSQVIILFASINISFAQTPTIVIPITISDNSGGEQVLNFGLDSTATDGIDAHLGELERPPVPPTGVFDARFIGDDIGISIGQGLLDDYRQGTSTFSGSVIHEISYQVGSGTTITISWNLPTGVTGLLQDLLGGVIVNVNMNGSGSTTITYPDIINKLKMTISYSLTPAGSVLVTSPNGGENWVVGTSQNITWTSTSVTNVKIEYTTNNGTSWSNVIASTPASGGTYFWTVPNTPSMLCKIKLTDVVTSLLSAQSNGVFSIILPTSVNYEITPRIFSLHQNFPNPFNPSTKINFGLADKSKVTLQIYNALGQKVAELINGEYEAGYHNFDFDASGFSSGIYFYELIANPSTGNVFRDVKKMIVLK